MWHEIRIFTVSLNGAYMIHAGSRSINPDANIWAKAGCAVEHQIESTESKGLTA
jgi:hypothetical protein